MITVREFVKSGDAAWDVTREAFLTQLIDEVLSEPDCIIVIHRAQTYLVNKNCLSVKVKAVSNECKSVVGGE